MGKFLLCNGWTGDNWQIWSSAKSKERDSIYNAVKKHCKSYPPLCKDIVPLTGEETDVRRGTAQLSETGVFQTHGGELVNCLKQGVNK